jgi:LAO/AO transport system kinase
MRDLAGDPDIFIRSMASRGSLGGLAHTTAAMAQVLDAAGFEIVLVETVGAGQAEVDIARLAHTTIVVEAPGMGDEIQAIKAGILEIADILVINKADHAGVEHTERALRGMLELAHPVQRVFHHHGHAMEIESPAESDHDHLWVAPIQRTIALDGTGVGELAEAVEKHYEYLQASGDWSRRERARLESELATLLQDALEAQFRAGISKKQYDDVMAKVVKRKISPWKAVKTLLNGRAS